MTVSPWAIRAAALGREQRVVLQRLVLEGGRQLPAATHPSWVEKDARQWGEWRGKLRQSAPAAAVGFGRVIAS
jgi:hypothetical protein